MSAPSSPVDSEAAILSRLIEPDVESLPPEVAQGSVVEHVSPWQINPSLSSILFPFT